MNTQAVIFNDIAKVSFNTIDMPPPGPDEVQIQTICSTISAGTEGWALQDQFTWSKTQFPCVPGYQRTGIITMLGPEVQGWKIGERVMATAGSWEGPVKPNWGAHVAVANTPIGAGVYRIPDNVDNADASNAVVAQVGYNAAYRAKYSAGDWVLVYGDGLIGQCAAQAARTRGAKVILVGHRSRRLVLAQRYCADYVLNNHESNVVKTVQNITGQQHIPVVLDTVQKESAQREYVPLLEHGLGQIVYSGFTPGTVWADMALLQQEELTTHFVSGWTKERMIATLDLMKSGAMLLRPLITHRVAAFEAPALYQMIIDKSDDFLGLVIDWTEAE